MQLPLSSVSSNFKQIVLLFLYHTLYEEKSREILNFLGSRSVMHTVSTACVVYDSSTIITGKNTPGISKVQRSLLHIFQISSTFLLSLLSIHLRVQARQVTVG